ncbi:carbamoyl phosphate synthase small subunit [Hominifimenecus sp. rT4P-3]|uniref:carbamoyl phosphate synthase small subunit n=1 Tax=Hominifimenecus sp. rT4P-3 TaxID=3242979 RepID=UPI003DA1F202
MYFKGESFGAEAEEVIGEVVFTTGMTGYLETLTDPSYCGQIVVQTFPLIGNYGVISPDFESGDTHPFAYIVKEWCHRPSNFRSEEDLDTFFKGKNLPGLAGIDTRQLTKLLRENGTMNGKLTKKAPPYCEEELEQLRSYCFPRPVLAMTRKKMETFPAPLSCYRVVLWDFGAKQNIIRELNQRNCDVIAVPADTTAEMIQSLKPDGVMLSNGPGNPEENVEIIQELQKICEAQIPLFGICLGHQLLALARGGQTEKLKYGHRGANQPVKNLLTGRVSITSQNHGYAVRAQNLPKGAIPWFENVNDKTCEGLRYTDLPACSVQFHPEACGGPKDTEALFEEFLSLMEQQIQKEVSPCR